MVTARLGHAQFGSPLVNLVYGLAPDGRYVHVSEVKSGLQTDLVCPAPGCGARLVARKGPLKADHFAHYEPTECSTGPETAAHALAKDILARRLALRLPAVEGHHAGRIHVMHPATEIAFLSARLERRLGDIVPDVVLELPRSELIVEIRLTHACDDAKVAKLAAEQRAGIEIDLRRFRHATEADLEEAVCRTAPRRWLFNRKHAAIPALIDAQIEAEATEKRRRLDHVAAKIQGQRYAARSTPEGLAAVQRVKEAGLGRWLRPVTRFPVFAAPDSEWQARLIGETVLNADTRWGAAVHFEADDLLDRLRSQKMLRAKFHKGCSKELAERLRARAPEFLTPFEALERYVSSLRDDGFLYEGKNGVAVIDRVLHGVAETRERRARLEQLKNRVSGVVSHLAPDAAFDAEAWLGTPLRAHRRSPLALCRDGGQGWSDLDRAVASLERLRWSDTSVPSDLLELPVNAAVAQIARRKREREAAEAERARAQAEAEANAREARVRAVARYVFDDVAEQWLLDQADEASSPLDTARSSDAGSAAVLARLAPLKAQEDERRRREQVAAESRRELRAEAEKILSDRYRQLWLNTTQPALGASPLAYCEDPATLAACLRILRNVPKHMRGY